MSHCLQVVQVCYFAGLYVSHTQKCWVQLQLDNIGWTRVVELHINDTVSVPSCRIAVMCALTGETTRKHPTSRQGAGVHIPTNTIFPT